MTVAVQLDFFAANDLNGDVIFTMTDQDDYFESISLDVQFRKVGGGVFVTNRKIGHAMFADGIFSPEVFVRVLIPSISATKYVWGFFLDLRKQKLISSQEEGGEKYTIGGPGPHFYRTRAALFPIQFSADGDFPYRLDLPNWQFAFEGGSDGADAGNVLKRMRREDDDNTYAEFLPDETYDYNEDHDSNMDPWADDMGTDADPFTLPIGQSYMENDIDVQKVVTNLDYTWNLGTVATPLFKMSAWQDFGRDLTPSGVDDFASDVVHFKEAVNIEDELDNHGASLRKATHVIVKGKDSAFAIVERPSWTPGDYAKVAFVDYGRTTHVGSLERRGLRWLRHQDSGESEFELSVKPGWTPTDGLYMPGPDGTDGHFWIGDSVGLTTGMDSPSRLDFRADPQLVSGVKLNLLPAAKTDTDLQAARSWDVKVQFNEERQSDISASSSGGESTTGAVGGCNCPGIAHECNAQGADNTMIDWDWSPCAEVPWTDALSGVPGSNAWGSYVSDGWTTTPGCSTGARRGESKKWAVAPGDVIGVSITAARYGGAGGSWPTTLSMRFYNSLGSFISSSGVTINMGGLSHEGGDHGNYITSAASYIAPAGAAYASLKQSTWSTFNVQHVSATTPAAVVGNTPYCVYYGTFPHDSPDTLPSDYLVARLQAILDAIAGLELNSLVDVDADPADGDVLTWDDALGLWVADAPTGGAGGHTIENNGTPLTARTGLNFTPPLIATDDAGNDETDISVDLAESGDISTQAFGDSPAAGASTSEVAGAQHKHGMPANPVTAHEAASDPHTAYMLESLASAKGELWGASANDTPSMVAASTEGQMLVGRAAATPGNQFETIYSSLTVTIGNGVTVIAAGIKGYVRVPFACEIVRETILADQSGAIKIDVWVDTYANYPPDNSDSITGGNEPEIAASGTKDEDSTLTSWTKPLAEGSVIGINVDSCTSIKQVTFELRVKRT